jgi:hypothetical protein
MKDIFSIGNNQEPHFHPDYRHESNFGSADEYQFATGDLKEFSQPE